jgi:hypothetical protein
VSPACQLNPSRAARRLYLLPAAPRHPYAQYNRADDEQDTYELAARRVIGLSVHDSGDAERDHKEGKDDALESRLAAWE